MPRAVAIENVGQAFEVVKRCRRTALSLATIVGRWRGPALAAILEERVAVAVERHLDDLAALGEADRNGSYGRRLPTALGAIELSVPRTRTFSAGAVLRAYARREAEIDRMILVSFVLGLSTRKVGEALLPILGERISASTVSRVAKVLDQAVAGFHARPLRAATAQLGICHDFRRLELGII
jgi:transposase-like protein